MVAYSFKRSFVAQIQVGLGQIERIDGTEYQPKRQTIRANRKRHARPGEELQLYCAMRTKHCFLIGRARCVTVEPIRLDFGQWPAVYVGQEELREGTELDQFAKRDGFSDWFELFSFWRKEHGHVVIFFGQLIRWEALR
jgi:hypothetical protein